jgi:hypothetical protein
MLGIHTMVVTRYRNPEARTRPFLSSLKEEGRRVAVFSPFSQTAGSIPETVDPYLHNTNSRPVDGIERPGPVIEIWQMK